MKATKNLINYTYTSTGLYLESGSVRCLLNGRRMFFGARGDFFQVEFITCLFDKWHGLVKMEMYVFGDWHLGDWKRKATVGEYQVAVELEERFERVVEEANRRLNRE